MAGTSVVLEVSSVDGMDESAPVEALREACGPPDPVLGRALRPHSIRARFGESRILNAVHCTDLEEDVGRELALAFHHS